MKRTARKGSAALVIIPLIVWTAWRVHQRYFNTVAEVVFWDVGQGDAAWIRLPRGRQLLVDAGGGYGSWDLGKVVVFPELARQGVLSLDWALLSHPDQDHFYGFRGVFEHLSVKQFWLARSALVSRKPAMKQLLQLARERNTHIVGFEKKGRFNFGGAKLKLWNFPEMEKTNDRSIVLYLEIYGCRFLFTGDIGDGVEQKLLSELGEVDVLKVAHHGSRYASSVEFLDVVRPRYAVISAGRSNRYGHPHEKALLRLRDSTLLRTDFHGKVRFRVDPSGKLDCDSTLGSCGEHFCGETSENHGIQ